MPGWEPLALFCRKLKACRQASSEADTGISMHFLKRIHLSSSKGIVLT